MKRSRKLLPPTMIAAASLAAGMVAAAAVTRGMNDDDAPSTSAAAPSASANSGDSLAEFLKIVSSDLRDRTEENGEPTDTQAPEETTTQEEAASTMDPAAGNRREDSDQHRGNSADERANRSAGAPAAAPESGSEVPPPETPTATAPATSPAPAPRQAPAQQASPSTSGGVTRSGLASRQSEMVTVLNADRAANGLAPLARMTAMDSTAQGWAEHMAGTETLVHNPDYSQQIPGGWMLAAENVLYDWTLSPSHWQANWMDSAGHRANILNGAFTHVGVGFAQSDDGRYYAVQIFAAY